LASAQVTPAAGVTPPDDTPSIRVGATLFANYTYTDSPKATDADGNLYNPSSFDVARAYINVTGNISHLIAFRFTPDITRETNATPSVSGSLVYRVKYAYAQFNLDDWMTRGSWVRFGANQTPLIDYEEGIYRYRFQGTTFAERETAPNGSGFLTSSDFGLSFHGNFPSNFGDIHAGIYNGEGYSKAEANNQPAFQIRGTVRPLAIGPPVLRGIRFTGFYDSDNYVKNADKKRAVFQATYEYVYVNAGFDYLHTEDQTSAKPGTAHVKGSGWSFWINPKSKMGLELLYRYDHFQPDTSISDRNRPRTIVGVSYWFPHQGNVSTAILVDYDGQTFHNYTPGVPAQKKYAVHALLNF
jgi:hypothetical protein